MKTGSVADMIVDGRLKSIYISLERTSESDVALKIPLGREADEIKIFYTYNAATVL